METATFDIFEISATIEGAKEYNREGLDYRVFWEAMRWIFWLGTLHLTGVHSHIHSIFIDKFHFIL